MRLFNMTSDPLVKISEHLDGGEFTNPFQPPQTILPGQFGEWRAESAGIGTGTEGSVDYEVEGKGDRIHFGWDNPAVGKTTFPSTPPTRADGSPSDYVFFAIHLGLDMSVEPDPVTGPQVVVVTQGDQDNDGVLLPIPFAGQGPASPHAFFGIGIRNRREPISLRSWFKALHLDLSQGLGQILIPHLSVRRLVELPV
jgi:hypothetical protein